MSLVNDVLRQLDDASSKPYQGMPLHSAMSAEIEKNNSILRKVFILLIIILSIIVTLQTFYSHSLVDIFYFYQGKDLAQKSLVQKSLPKNSLAQNSLVLVKKEDAAVPKEVLVANDVTSKLILGKLKDKDKEFLGNNTVEHDSAENSDTDNQPIESSTVKNDVIDNNPIDNNPIENNSIENDAIENIDIKNESINDDEVAQVAIINTVEKMGFKQYQLALQAYRQKHSSSALSWINLALEKEKREEYLSLKVRILIQQDNGDELHKLALEQGNNTSLTWFELIAPSLQMYSYHELSNKYYSELIRQQPNEIKWQLAMALNYTRLGLKDDAYSVYKNLLTSTLLTYKQTRWIASRLESIQKGEVATNDK